MRAVNQLIIQGVREAPEAETIQPNFGRTQGGVEKSGRKKSRSNKESHVSPEQPD
jgi:hypothetical protein